jgi:hypothetical protein
VIFLTQHCNGSLLHLMVVYFNVLSAVLDNWFLPPSYCYGSAALLLDLGLVSWCYTQSVWLLGRGSARLKATQDNIKK